MSERCKIKVLHLTPHFGGGVGTVLLENLQHSLKVDPDIASSVVCLDYLNDHSKKAMANLGIPFHDCMHSRPGEILNLISEADVTLVHWWNHPLLTDFIIRQHLPPCRLIFWCHITGSHAPNNLTDRLMTYPDYFVFTTPISRDVPEYQNLSSNAKGRVSVIWSTGGSERLAHLSPKKHLGFHVGYIGNLDRSKIHPNFIQMCAAINIPDVRFTVVGAENPALTREAADLGIKDRITFTGFLQSERWDLLSTFDVFGYPLAPHHFGSCDQTIQEAMTLGITPVVMDNKMESHMVRHEETGLVARNEQEYVKAIEGLYHNPEKRMRLGNAAKKFAKDNYSVESCRQQWRELFDKTMREEKSPKSWGKFASPPSAAEVFVESLGRYSGPFLAYLQSPEREISECIKALNDLAKSSNWTSPTKSTVHHFLQFFPNDAVLKEWAKIMKSGV